MVIALPVVVPSGIERVLLLDDWWCACECWRVLCAAGARLLPRCILLLHLGCHAAERDEVHHRWVFAGYLRMVTIGLVPNVGELVVGISFWLDALDFFQAVARVVVVTPLGGWSTIASKRTPAVSAWWMGGCCAAPALVAIVA